LLFFFTGFEGLAQFIGVLEGRKFGAEFWLLRKNATTISGLSVCALNVADFKVVRNCMPLGRVLSFCALLVAVCVFLRLKGSRT
jgi:hypothetical protein